MPSIWYDEVCNCAYSNKIHCLKSNGTCDSIVLVSVVEDEVCWCCIWKALLKQQGVGLHQSAKVTLRALEYRVLPVVVSRVRAFHNKALHKVPFRTPSNSIRVFATNAVAAHEKITLRWAVVAYAGND